MTYHQETSGCDRALLPSAERRPEDSSSSFWDQECRHPPLPPKGLLPKGLPLFRTTELTRLSMEPSHPSDEQLRRYSSGRLDEAACEPIEEHLNHCAACCSRLSMLAASDDDPLVLKLRQADSSLNSLQNGWRLGDFRLLRIIGQGGMGIVYEAIQESLGRRVALKILPIADIHEAEAVRRFRREARAAANLHHPNIVPIYEMGETCDCQYFAMPLINGCSLADLFMQMRNQVPALVDEQAETLAPERRARWIAHLGYQVATALAHAHAHGVVHRDIKPSNLLLDDQGVVWVVDFGSALFDDDDLTQPGQLIGTLRYLSPERLRGEADERCDIYALGVTLYELLVRRRLFDTTNRLQAIDRILHGVPLPPRKIDPSIPKALESIILRAITKDPKRRYQRAADLADDLQRFYNDEPIHSRRSRLPELLWQTLDRIPLIIRQPTAIMLMLFVGGVSLAIAVQHLQRINQELAKKLQNNDMATRLALQSARNAHQASQQWQETLVKGYLQDAANLMNQGASLAALPHLCNALKLEPDVPAQLRQRMRIAAILNYSPRPLGTWQHDGSIQQLRLSTDNTQLFVVTASGDLHICPTGISLTDSHLSQTDPHTPSDSLVEQVDELHPLVEGEFFMAYVGSSPTPSRTAAIQWLEPIRIAQRSNDGNQVAIAGSGNFVSLADVSGNDPQPLQLPTPAPATALAFSLDDRLLAVGSANGTVQLWDLALPGCTALAEDELLAAVAAAQNAPEAPDATCCEQLPVGFEVICTAEDPDEQLTVFGGNLGRRGGCLQVWDTRTGFPLTPVIFQPVAVTSVELHAGSASVAYHCQDGIGGEIHFAANPYSLDTLQAIAAACAGKAPPPRNHTCALPPADLDAWRLRRIDDALRRREGLIVQRRLEALPTELLALPRISLIRALVAANNTPYGDTQWESHDAVSRSPRSDGYP